MKKSSSYSSPILMLIITLLGFALRVAFLEDRPVTIDEISSLKWLAGRSVLEIATDYHTNIHLLTTILARLIDYGGGGHWLTFYRAPAVIFGVLVIPLTYQVGRRLFDESAGILAALLLAFAPFHIDFSMQMRGYTALAFWATAMYFCLWQGIQTGRPRYWGGLAIAAILAVYAHLFGALAVGASWLIVLGTYLWQRWLGRFLAPQTLKVSKSFRVFRPLISSLLFTVAGIVLLYGPILGRVINTPEIEGEWQTQVEALVVEGRLNTEALEDYLKVLRLYGPIGEPNSWFVMSFVILAGLGLLAALSDRLSAQKRTGQAGFYIALWIFAPMVVAACGLQFVHGFYVFRRFFIFFQPLYLLLLAAGLLTVGRLATWWSGRMRIGHGLTACLIMITLGAAGWKLYHQTSEDIDNQWRRVAQTILAQGENPMVICEANGQRMVERARHKDECYSNLEFYFQPALNTTVPWLHYEIDKVATIPGATHLPHLQQQGGDAWLVIWQREWPPEWPSLLQTSHVAGLTYYTLGSTLLVHAPTQPVQLLALANIVEALIPLETTPQDRFAYYLSQAQMKAVVGDRDTARNAWLAARELSPDGVDAENRLRTVAELIGMTELLGEEGE